MSSFRLGIAPALSLRRILHRPQPLLRGSRNQGIANEGSNFSQRAAFRLPRSKSTEVPTIYKPRREPWVNPTMLFIGFIPIFTFALGTWQLQRLQWKVALIDELEEKLQLQPLSLPDKIKYDVQSLTSHIFADNTSCEVFP